MQNQAGDEYGKNRGPHDHGNKCQQQKKISCGADVPLPLAKSLIYQKYVPVRNDVAQKGAGELARRWIKQSCGVKGHVDQRLCDQQSCLVVFCKVVQTKLRRILQAVAETTPQRRTKTCMPVCDASS